jgi:TatD DNase family protein
VIDTHAHLDVLEDDAAAVVRRARAAGVSRIVAIGSGLASARATVDVAEREDGVFAALGIHPHQAGDHEDLGELEQLLTSPAAVAVGEIGLDYHRDRAPRDRQRALFERQLSLATALGLPVVIHSRSAAADTAGVLESHPGTVVLHCFSEPELLPAALDRGYYVSFAGNVTYPNADDLRRAAAAVPADRILAETDAPYLSPQPCRGRPNEPAFVLHTLGALAAVRGVDAEELGAQIDANATRAFGLP